MFFQSILINFFSLFQRGLLTYSSWLYGLLLTFLRKAVVGKSSAFLNDMYVCLIGIFLNKYIYIKANLLKIQIRIDELQVK